MLAGMEAEGISVGHLYLRPPGAAPARQADQITVPLDAEPADGEGLLALRLLSPIAALPAALRGAMHILVAGSGSALPLRAAEAMGCDEVRLWGRDPVDDGMLFHRVLYGCEGGVPELDELRPLIALLGEEGQIGLYDLPANQVPALQKSLARHGFSLRAAGTQDLRGYLAGSVENPASFRVHGG